MTADQLAAATPGASAEDPAGHGMRRGRPGSVRARVSLACAAVAVVLVVTLAVLVVALLTRREYAELDRRLTVAAQALQPAVADDFPAGLDAAFDSVRGRFLLRALAPGLVATVGQDGTALRTASAADTTGSSDTTGPPDSTGGVEIDGPAVAGPSEVPVRPLGRRTVDLDGADYRLLTVAVRAVPDATLTVALPAELAAAPVRAIRLWGIVIGALAALAGGGLGWAAAGVAVRPLRQLRDRTRAVDGRAPMPTRAELTAGAPGSAVETEELADAIAGLLSRVQLARDEAERILQNARDFAAAADHELRTPLTTIQTDLDVLLAHPDLEAGQRREILDEVAGAKTRMLETLQALRALADADATVRGSYTGRVDVADLAGRVVDAARPGAGAVQLSVVLPDHDTLVLGSAAGLRLAIENLVRNAIRHAHARRIEVSVRRWGGWIVVRVDDDGVGLPEAERERVFARFTRGSQAVGAGSGLGLALAAQQADLHGGRARLTDSPWGGLCAELMLPRSPETE